MSYLHLTKNEACGRATVGVQMAVQGVSPVITFVVGAVPCVVVRDGPSPPASKPPPTPTTEPRDLYSTRATGSSTSVPVGTVTPYHSSTVPDSVPGGAGDWTRGLASRPSALPSYILTAPMPPSSTSTPTPGTQGQGQGQGQGLECESPMSLMIRAALQSASAFVQEQERAAPTGAQGLFPTAATAVTAAPVRGPSSYPPQTQVSAYPVMV